MPVVDISDAEVTVAERNANVDSPVVAELTNAEAFELIKRDAVFAAVFSVLLVAYVAWLLKPFSARNLSPEPEDASDSTWFCYGFTMAMLLVTFVFSLVFTPLIRYILLSIISIPSTLNDVRKRTGTLQFTLWALTPLYLALVCKMLIWIGQ